MTTAAQPRKPRFNATVSISCDDPGHWSVAHVMTPATVRCRCLRCRVQMLDGDGIVSYAGHVATIR